MGKQRRKLGVIVYLKEKEKYLFAYKSNMKEDNKEKSMKITVKKKHIMEEHKGKEDVSDI